MFLCYNYMKTYNLDQYNHVIFEGFSYNLPENVVSIIDGLKKEVESFAPAALSTTSSIDDKSKRTSHFGNKKPKNKRNEQSEDWNAMRSFKTTVIEKKEGSEKIVNEIRATLNKISSKNYASQKENLINYVKELCTENDAEIYKISASLFEVAKNNKFNSLIYANLLKELSELFPKLCEPLDDFLNAYKESIANINYADPNSDYDKYCEFNKLNDTRKAISTYLSNLSLIGFIEKSEVIELVINLQKYVNEYIDIENKINEVDEITENLYIFVIMLNDYLKKEDRWLVVVENIIKISTIKSKDKKSLSSRAVFKYMDILDSLRK